MTWRASAWRILLATSEDASQLKKRGQSMRGMTRWAIAILCSPRSYLAQALGCNDAVLIRCKTAAVVGPVRVPRDQRVVMDAHSDAIC
jgi:hypothetical protein